MRTASATSSRGIGGRAAIATAPSTSFASARVRVIDGSSPALGRGARALAKNGDGSKGRAAATRARRVTTSP